MSIQKKTLISTLKSAKKANLTKSEVSLDHSHSTIKAQPVMKSAKKQPVVKLTAVKSLALKG